MVNSDQVFRREMESKRGSHKKGDLTCMLPALELHKSSIKDVVFHQYKILSFDCRNLFQSVPECMRCGQASSHSLRRVWSWQEACAVPQHRQRVNRSHQDAHNTTADQILLCQIPENGMTNTSMSNTRKRYDKYFYVQYQCQKMV